MRQQVFEDRHQALWQAFAARLDLLEKRRKAVDNPLPADEFPAVYRQLCQHLALARARRYSSGLIAYLEQLTLRAHQQLYRAPRLRSSAILAFLLDEFPRLVRQEWRLVLLCTLLFYGPFLVLAALVYRAPELIYTLLPPDSVADFEAMYQPDGSGGDRAAESDVLMFGFYIYNNIGIGLRTFGAGLLFGVGSAFILLFNGTFLGAVTGYVVQRGYGETFFPFVIGHGAFELTGIVLAGVAGLRLGLTLLLPGPYTRLEALRRMAHVGLRLVYGVVALLLIAAFVEAFWSSNRALPAEVRYTVGGLFWLLVIAYLTLAGRRAA